MTPKLYIFDASPPCRTVLMVAKSIGLELEVIRFEKPEDRFKPEHLKLNPQHTVPILVEDDGFVVTDSHAIVVYIILKYATDKSLYPDDLKLKSVIDQRLHFDSGVLFQKLRSIMLPVILKGKKEVNAEDKESVNEAYRYLEAFLGDDRPWIAGKTLTVADFSILPNISSLNVLCPIDPKKYPKLITWKKNFQKLSIYEIEKNGLEAHKLMFEHFGLKYAQ